MKDGQPSFSSRKKLKASSSRGFQGQGHGYQGQGHIRDPSKSGSMTYETRLPVEAGILGLWDTSVPVISGTCTNIVSSSLSSTGYGNRYQALGTAQAPTALQAGQRG